MKKLVSCLLVMVMFVFVLAGCSSDSSESDNAAEESGTSEEASAVPEEKSIGVIIWGTDDMLGSQTEQILNYAGEALNINFVFKTGDYDTESQVASAENFAASGMDGILCVPISDSAIPQIYKVCEEYEMAFGLMFRNIQDPEVASQMAEAEYYTGCAVENEEEAGKKVVELFEESGAENIAKLFIAPGAVVNDRRQAGMNEALSASDMAVLAETVLAVFPNNTDSVNAMNNFLNMYPDMDGVLCSSGTMGIADGVIATIKQNTDAVGKVKVATLDQPTEMIDAFENNILSVCATGTYTDPLYSAIIMANYLQGNPLSDKPVEINTNYIYITNTEDAQLYEDYTSSENANVYTTEEIQNMTKWYNSEFSVEDLEEIVSQWSMEFIKENY